MTINTVKETLRSIKEMDRSKSAAIARLQKAGILTKSGKMTALYRRCIKAQSLKG